jgi:hypothetical protein
MFDRIGHGCEHRGALKLIWFHQSRIARSINTNCAMFEQVLCKFHHPVVVFVVHIYFMAVNSGLCVLSIPSLRKFLENS